MTASEAKDLNRIYIRKGGSDHPILVAMPAGNPKPDEKDKPIVTVTVSTPPK